MPLKFSQFNAYYGINISADEKSWPLGTKLPYKLFKESIEIDEADFSPPIDLEPMEIENEVQENYYKDEMLQTAIEKAMVNLSFSKVYKFLY